MQWFVPGGVVFEGCFTRPCYRNASVWGCNAIREKVVSLRRKKVHCHHNSHHNIQRELAQREGFTFYQSFLRAQPMSGAEFGELARGA